MLTLHGESSSFSSPLPKYGQCAWTSEGERQKGEGSAKGEAEKGEAIGNDKKKTNGDGAMRIYR